LIDGMSFYQFVATDVAEILDAMNTAALSLERRKRVNDAVFDKIIRRKGREKPELEDRSP
jgi:hypothetical protein